MIQVYLGTLYNTLPVAVKVTVLRQAGAGEVLRLRQEQEAALLYSCRHPGVLQVWPQEGSGG